jgi:hypothetical protein
MTASNYFFDAEIVDDELFLITRSKQVATNMNASLLRKMGIVLVY